MVPARIALAADPSDPAHTGLRHACFLASATGADLVVLPVGCEGARGDEHGDAGAGTELLAAARRMASVPIRVRMAGALPADGVRRPPPRPAKPQAQAEPPSTSVEGRIQAWASRAGAQLLVMPRGERWSGALYLLLSVSERVLVRASLPVLVVPDRSGRDRVTMAAEPRILLLQPDDGGSRLECLLWAATLAHPLEATVLSTSPDSEAREGRGLRGFIGRHRADLVVVPGEDPERGSRAAGFPSGLVSAAVRTAPCPVLVVPAPRSAAVSITARRGPLPTGRVRSLRTGSVEIRTTGDGGAES